MSKKKDRLNITYRIEGLKEYGRKRKGEGKRKFYVTLYITPDGFIGTYTKIVGEIKRGRTHGCTQVF